MSVAPLVAVVIPCRNEAGTIAHVLDALIVQTRRPDAVVVVNDASHDETAGVTSAWAAAHPELPLDLVAGTGRGVAAAVNTGIAATAADIIVRLDGHCRPRADYIARSLESLNHPGAGVVGGVWRIESGAPTGVARGIAAVLSHPLGAGGVAYRQVTGGAPRAVDTVPFGAFRRTLWETLNGFDESLLRNEDYDFNHRTRLAGFEVVLDPSTVSIYRARATLSALWRQYFAYGFWKVVMLRKFPASLRLRQFLPVLLLPSLVILALWTAATGASLPLLCGASYVAVNVAAGLQTAVRARDLGLVVPATAALLTLQIGWSVGAWVSLLRGPRAATG